MLGLLPHIRPRIRHKAVAVRHLHLGQTLGVHHLIGRDDAVKIENIRYQRVYFRRLQQTRLVERHRPIDVIPHRRRVGPIAPYRLERLRCRERACPPTSAGPTSPLAFSPWHLEHRAAKISRPAAAVPEPSGSPVPSGAIVVPKPRICSSVARCPTPYFGDCATVRAAPASTITLSF